MAIVFKAT